MALTFVSGVSSAAPAAEGPADPLGLDAGAAKDEAAFLAWVKDPRAAPMHPLAKLKLIVQKDPKNRADYFTFLTSQAGIKGPGAKALKAMAETIYVRGPLMDSPPTTRELQQKDAKLAVKLEKQGREFFRLVPRAARVRVYKIGEKFEVARLALLNMVTMAQSEITDTWIDQERAEEARNEAGYFFGLCKDRDAATVRAITEDFKLTVTFMLTFAGPPSYIRGDKDRNKFRAQKRAGRAKLLQGLQPISF
jgi:hypothetical protein